MLFSIALIPLDSLLCVTLTLLVLLAKDALKIANDSNMAVVDGIGELRADQPCASRWVASAPCSTRALTTARWPCVAERMRGVWRR